eukprot:6821842-Pyramimonas_sp.AAC.1
MRGAGVYTFAHAFMFRWEYPSTTANRNERVGNTFACAPPWEGTCSVVRRDYGTKSKRSGRCMPTYMGGNVSSVQKRLRNQVSIVLIDDSG